MSVNDFFMCPIWIGESAVYTGTPPAPPAPPPAEGDRWIGKEAGVIRRRMSVRKKQLTADFFRAELYGE